LGSTGWSNEKPSMSTPTTSPRPPPPRAPPALRSREAIYVGIGVTVAVVVLVIAFVAAPALMPSSTGAILTYSGARPVADRAVGGFEGGGWNLLFAAGLVSATSLTVPVNGTTISSLNCTFTPNGPAESLSLPGFDGNRSSGLAPAWEFGYGSLSEGIALVSVIDGKGVVVGTLTGGRCIASGLLPQIPGNVIDSSQAAAAVQPYARAFLSVDPNASAVFGLGPGVAFGGSGLNPDWFVVYSTCSASLSANTTGSEFNATVNALTGTVIVTHTAAGVACGSSGFTAVRTVGSPLVAPVVRAPSKL